MITVSGWQGFFLMSKKLPYGEGDGADGTQQTISGGWELSATSHLKWIQPSAQPEE